MNWIDAALFRVILSRFMAVILSLPRFTGRVKDLRLDSSAFSLRMTGLGQAVRMTGSEQWWDEGI